MALTLATDINKFRLSGSPAFLKVHTNKGSEPNIRIDCSVLHVPWTGSPVVVGTDSQTPDAGGHCTFDLSEYFSKAKPIFTFPDTGIAPKLHPVNSAKYVLWLNEVYGAPPTSQLTLILPDNYFATKGKISGQIHHPFYREYSSFNYKITSATAELTLQTLAAQTAKIPFVLKTAPADIQKIFVMAPSDLADGIQLKIDIIYSDGTTLSDFSAHPRLYPFKGQVCEFHTGYNSLGLTPPSGKSIVSYTCTITHSFGATTINYPVTYVLDNAYYPHRRQFIFRNSLGAFDTFAATGKATTETDYDYTIADSPAWPGTAAALRQNIRATTSDTIKCNTGFVSLTTLSWLSELWNSTEVYEISGSSLIPVLMHKQTILRHTDDTGLYHVDFDYEHPETLRNE